MDEFANPYRPGAGTQPPALMGRDDLIHRFEMAIRRAKDGRPGKCAMAVGLRGVGKTVLLNRAAEIADSEGFGVAYIEAPETREFRTLVLTKLRKAVLEYERKRVAAKVLRAMRVLKSFSLQLSDGSKVSIDVDALAGQADSGNLAEDLTDVLVAVGEAAADHGSGLLIAIDEVQYLRSDELAALITSLHRTTQLNLPVVMIGAGLPQLPSLAGEAKSYAERLFDFPAIGSLNDVDARDAIAMPALDLEVEFSAKACQRIVVEAQGYPYFLQEWGYHVWNAAETSPIGEKVVEEARERVLADLDENFFRVRFDRLTPAEKTYLRAMAEMGPGPHRSGDIAAELGAKVESIAPRRSGLITKGMIYSPAHGDTAFTVPLFDQFLRRAMP